MIRDNAGRISGAQGAARFRASLVTVQLALATTLLIAAGLFVKSLVNVTRVDLGMRVDDVVTFRLAPERSGYDSTRALLLYDRVADAVGAIPDVKYSDLKQAAPPLFYTPWRQDTHVGTMNFYVRSPQADALLRALPAVLKTIDPSLPMEGLKTMPAQIRDNVSGDRLISILSAAFAVLATLLAAVVLYGVLAYSVAQRTREIGVRIALGADAGRVRAMVLRQMSGMMLVGGGIGLVGALGLGRAAQSLLYGLEGHDPVVFALAALMLTLVALGAVYVPARRASLVDPVRALRYE